MDISVVDELPQGRRDVQTLWVEMSNRDYAYNFLKEQLKEGRQAYIVYPVIEESVTLKSEGARKMYETLSRETFKEYRLGLLHGRLSDEEKIKVMKEFKKGKVDILVATTIIEVGIDIPNAAVMIVENAERFGLSQLHQLRGRIGRSKFRSYCILVSDARTEESRQRLEVISTTDDAIKIAQEDLNIRGPGELFGRKQHGLPELQLGNVVTDIDILKHARKEAFGIIKQDPNLEDESHSKIKKMLLRDFKDKFHLGFMG